MEQMYVPSPIDTSGVTLPERYAPLVEEIARTAHNDWYASRIAEGKTAANTPGLVPWRSLGEAGKASALGQARETLLVLESRFGLDNVLSGKVGKEAVVDAVAENAHEVWSKQRMDSGWTFGEVRDNAAKVHPMLKPYSELPESEKEYYKAYGRVAADRAALLFRSWKFDAMKAEKARLVRDGDPARLLSAVRAKSKYEAEVAGKERTPFFRRLFGGAARDPYPGTPLEELIGLLNYALRPSDVGGPSVSLEKRKGVSRDEWDLVRSANGLESTLASFYDTIDGGEVASWEEWGLSDSSGKLGLLHDEAVKPSGSALEMGELGTIMDAYGHAGRLDGEMRRLGDTIDYGDMGVKRYIQAYEELESIRSGAGLACGDALLARRAEDLKAYLNGHDVDLSKDIVSRMDYSALSPDDRSLGSRNEWAHSTAVNEYLLSKGLDPSALDRSAMWNDESFVRRYAYNCTAFGVPDENIRQDVELMSDKFNGHTSFLYEEEMNARHDMAQSFKDAVKAGRPEEAYRFAKERYLGAKAAFSNAERAKAAMSLEGERFRPEGEAPAVKMTEPQRMLYEEMMEGMAVAEERGTLPKFLKDAGIDFLKAPDKADMRDVVAEAAVKMYGDGSVKNVKKMDAFKKRNDADLKEGRRRKFSRDFAARQERMDPSRTVRKNNGNKI